MALSVMDEAASGTSLKLPYTSATDFPEFVEYHQVLTKDFSNQSEQAVSFRSMVAAAQSAKSLQGNRGSISARKRHQLRTC